MPSRIWVCPNALKSYTAVRRGGDQTITVDVDKVDSSNGEVMIYPRAIVHLKETDIQIGSGTSASMPGSTSNTTHGPQIDLPRSTASITFNFVITAQDMYMDYSTVGQVWANYYSMDMWAQIWVDKGGGATKVAEVTHIGTYPYGGTLYSSVNPVTWSDSISYAIALGADEDAVAQLRIGKTRRSWKLKAPQNFSYPASLWEYDIGKPYAHFPEENALASATINYCVIGE